MFVFFMIYFVNFLVLYLPVKIVKVSFVLLPNFVTFCSDVMALFLHPVTLFPADINVGLKRDVRNLEYIHFG
jgi:hypothetical protein